MSPRQRPKLPPGVDRLVYRWKNWFRLHRRNLFRRFRSVELDADVQRFRKLIIAGDWEPARPLAMTIATRAEQLGDYRLCNEMAQALHRLGVYGRSAQLKLASRHIRKGRDPREWLGQDIAGRTLLLDLMEHEKQGLATAIHHASSVHIAAGRCAKCMVIVERRLVPIFARTFPDVDVFSAMSTAALRARKEADFFASAQHLAAAVEPDAATIERQFFPLAADAADAARLRVEYGGSRKPLVGVSWGSSNVGKDLPPLESWRKLLDLDTVQFVSLQYGDLQDQLAVLRSGKPGRLIHDPSVDQLVDMDRFAAQLAALDAVVTISNTGAHLAGAMGIPTIVLLGDRFQRSWPVDLTTSPYYPQTRLIWKKRRGWPDVIDEAAKELAALCISQPRPVS
jgi:hypothetical protein